MEIQKYNDAVRLEKALKIMSLQVEGASLEDACSEVGITRRTFYAWVSGGLLDAELELAGEARTRTTRDIAISGAETIMLYMVAIASGKKVTKASPVKAAEFVYRHAGIKPRVKPEQPPPAVNVLIGMPEQVVFDIRDGAPRLVDGKPVIVSRDAPQDAEFEELG